MNLYEVLGFQEMQVKFSELPQALIKKAYRELSRKHHPDHGGDPQVFVPIVEAYTILSDPKKRAEYDKTGVVPDSSDWAYNEATSIIGDLTNQMVDQLLQAGHEDLQNDCVKMMKKHVSKKITENDSVLHKLDMAQTLRGNIKDRTFTKDDDGLNIIHGALDQLAETWITRRKEIEKALVILNKALELLDKHGCNPPPEQELPTGLTWSITVPQT